MPSESQKGKKLPSVATDTVLMGNTFESKQLTQTSIELIAMRCDLSHPTLPI